MEEVDGEHFVFEVEAEDVGVFVVGGGDALLVLGLVDGDDLVAEAGGELELHVFGGLGHALVEAFFELVGAAFEEELDVADGLFVDVGGGEAVDAGAEAALNVELQAGAGVVAGEVDLAGGDQEGAVDEVDEAVGEVAGEVGAEVLAAIFAELACDKDLGVAVAQGEFDVGVGLVVAKEDVEAGLALLDEVVFKGEGFALVVDGDVVDVDGLAHEGAGFGIALRGFEEVGADAGAEVFGLADVDDLALGVFVEVAAGLGGDGADFGEEVHGMAAPFSLERAAVGWSGARRGVGGARSLRSFDLVPDQNCFAGGWTGVFRRSLKAMDRWV